MSKKSIVEEIISGTPQWSKELFELRDIINSTDLEETVKWKIPTYTLEGKNVLGLGGFKHHYALWFFNGSFLSDPDKILRNAQEGKTRGMRQIRFTTESKIDKKQLLSYINEAIQNQREGKEIKPERKKVEMPSELLQALNGDASFKSAFEKLTPGKQKDYKEHILDAKREATKLSRIEKIKPLILDGKGLHDKYKNC